MNQMIADDFESIKKALEEIKREKEEQAARQRDGDMKGDSGQTASKPAEARMTSVYGIWVKAFPAGGQQADAQPTPPQATP